MRIVLMISVEQYSNTDYNLLSYTVKPCLITAQCRRKDRQIRIIHQYAHFHVLCFASTFVQSKSLYQG
jgi:hypothetical protein